MAENTQIAKSPMQRLKVALSVESVQEQFKNALQENTGPFIASIIDLYGSDTYLQACEPAQVIMECLKAATLKLPINKQIGFAYIVPYKSNGVSVPQFQLGYKGYIQLAMRTGQYKFLNAGVIYEGIKVKRNILTGEVEFAGEPTSDKAQGYFAYMELLNGYSKNVYMTHDEVLKHAKRYSKSFDNKNSAWKTNFEEMAIKTATRKLLSHYGFLSTEMVTALGNDQDDVDLQMVDEIAANANKETIDIAATVTEEKAEEGTAPPVEGQQQINFVAEGPGF
jgi:recombination protein RecT